MNKNKIYYLLLGLGLGVLITSSMNIAFDKTETVEYSEEEIREKAKELGMISMKDNIEKNEEDEKKAEEAKAKEEAKKEEEKAKAEQEKLEQEQAEAEVEPKSEPESAVVAVTEDDTATSIVDKLKSEGIIENAGDFKSVVVDHNLQREFIAGEYEINKGASYEDILKKMIRENKLKNSGFLQD